MKIRFIIADDAAFLREILKNVLTSSGAICVGEAANGDEAIELVKTFLPDLVFLDMVMPVRNGIETAKAIKEKFPSVKIIGCSTVDEVQVITKAYEAGFDEYITKPFTKEQILDAVEKMIPSLGERTYGST